MRILVVEDAPYKFQEVSSLLKSLLPPRIEIVRAETVVEAERQITKGPWDLIVLDISMDIAPGSSSGMRGGHANLGGMDVVEKMYLMEMEAPTVILTGLDYFIVTNSEGMSHETLDLSDIEKQARQWLSEKLLGCVRYGGDGWQERLSQAVKGISA